MSKLNLINIKKLKSPKINYIEYTTPISNILSLGFAEERGRQKGMHEMAAIVQKKVEQGQKKQMNKQQGTSPSSSPNQLSQFGATMIQSIPNNPSPSRPTSPSPIPTTAKKLFKEKFHIVHTPIEVSHKYKVYPSSNPNNAHRFGTTEQDLDKMHDFFNKKGFNVGSKRQFEKDLNDMLISKRASKVVPNTKGTWQLRLIQGNKGKFDLDSISKKLFP